MRRRALRRAGALSSQQEVPTSDGGPQMKRLTTMFLLIAFLVPFAASPAKADNLHEGAVSSSGTAAHTAMTARSYATAIFTHIAVPSGAARVTSPPEPLQSNLGTYVQNPSVD